MTTSAPSSTRALASTIPTSFGMWEAGKWTPASTGETLPLTDPWTGEAFTEVPSATADDADRFVRTARSAFESRVWAGLRPAERGRVLFAWADLIERDADLLAVMVSREMGKPAHVALEFEIASVLRTLRWFAGLSDKLMDESPRGLDDAVALVTREPLGVVAAILPWNFPLSLGMFKLAPALMAGNSVILKPALQTSASSLHLGALASRAGLPDGVLQVITGRGSTVGSALSLNHSVDCITFTGSTEVGLGLLADAGRSNGKSVSLELGGKSPNIIFADAPDLGKAISTAAWAFTFNSGQMCTAGSRLFVEESVYDEVLQGVCDELSKKVIGDPLSSETDMGPMCSRGQADGVLEFINSGLKAGARLAYGSAEAIDAGRALLGPAVFTDVTRDMEIYREEIFGPVVCVQPFRDEAHALELANDTKYGLGAGVWTNDVSRIHRMARGIDAGNVWVNSYEEGLASTPFAGRKLSGNGADNGTYAVDKYSHLKLTWITL